MFETTIINKVQYTHVRDYYNDYYETHARNCTGYGISPIKALLDLREKIKKKETNKVKNLIKIQYK